jgi:isoquinoline 1-oxidoreductase beta subunit
VTTADKGVRVLLDRRVLLVAATGGALLLALRAPWRTPDITPDDAAIPQLAGWVRVAIDGTVTVLVNCTELGQGATSALAQILVDELDAEWSQTRIEYAPVERQYYGPNEYSTGGSSSVSGNFELFRTAGATVRALLVAAAAKIWNVAVTECLTGSGQVLHAATGRRLDYGQLASDAAALPVPTDVTLKSRDQWRLIGKPIPRLNVAPRTDGTAIYGIDVRRPGMLVATLAHAPALGQILAAVDAGPALALSGVCRVVKLRNAVAVVGDSYWQARSGLMALDPVWSGTACPGTDEIRSRLAALKNSAGTAHRPDGVDERELRTRCEAALAGAFRRIERDYEVPMLAHAALEPMNATADVRPDRAELWLPTQVQAWTKEVVAKALALPEEAVTLHTTEVGGGFGRRLETDFAVQAALIAREVGGPVKLVWSREQDLQHDFYRTPVMARLTAGLDARGRITAMRAALASMQVGEPFEGLADQLYVLPNALYTCATWNPGVPLGAWRAVDPVFNLFFLESFVDELAAAVGAEPLAFRRRLLADNVRALRVLDAAARLGDWARPAVRGRGRGIALLAGFGSLAAEVVEASVDEENVAHVHRVACAVDCGTAVNPATIRQQFEGGVVFALSAAAREEVTLDGEGRVQQANFDAYPLVRINECPRIDVEILQTPDAEIGGIGEPPVPPLAPALANAIFAASGRRIRRLPLTRSGLRLGGSA